MRESRDKKEIRRLTQLIADVREAVGSRADDMELREAEEIQEELDRTEGYLRTSRAGEDKKSAEIRRLNNALEIARLDRHQLRQAAVQVATEFCARPEVGGKRAKCNQKNGWCHICLTKLALAMIKENNLKRAKKSK